jgi:2-keto-4-pentenoate hydratase/2-oxohepta-3-ene-1,7-dioic acid hydratase in catechol pathway
MRWVTVGPESSPVIGVVVDDMIFDPSPIAGRVTRGMREIMERGGDLHGRVASWLASDPDPIGSVGELPLLAPILDPGKILTIGNNYPGGSAPPPSSPPVSAKLASAIIGPESAITWDPSMAEQIDYEVELGVVIGRHARNLKEETALDAVFGYTCLNDVAARDDSYSGDQWLRAKSFDTFCPLGPWIVTADEIAEPNDLRLTCELSGEVLQDGHTSDTYFSVQEILAFLSRFFTLHPGDVISTGTPPGTGASREPPRFLRDGDIVVIEIERIGRLRNPVSVPAQL